MYLILQESYALDMLELPQWGNTKIFKTYLSYIILLVKDSLQQKISF